jgi:hypothetical protein
VGSCCAFCTEAPVPVFLSAPLRFRDRWNMLCALACVRTVGVGYPHSRIPLKFPLLCCSDCNRRGALPSMPAVRSVNVLQMDRCAHGSRWKKDPACARLFPSQLGTGRHCPLVFRAPNAGMRVIRPELLSLPSSCSAPLLSCSRSLALALALARSLSLSLSHAHAAHTRHTLTCTCGASGRNRCCVPLALVAPGWSAQPKGSCSGLETATCQAGALPRGAITHA